MKLRTLFGKLFVLVLTGFLLSLLVQPAPAQTNPRQPQEEKLLNGLKVLMWPDATAKNVARILYAFFTEKPYACVVFS